MTFLDHDLTFRNNTAGGLFEDNASMLARYNSGTLDLCGKMSLLKSFHHLLREHGEFYGKISESMMAWVVDDRHLSNHDDPALDDLRFAIMYGVEECQAKKVAMIVIMSRRKDWFLSYLSYFN